MTKGIFMALRATASFARLDKLKHVPRGVCFSLPAGRQPGLSVRAFMALLILAMFTGAALAAPPVHVPPKPHPKPQVHVAPRRPSPVQIKARPRAVRPPAPAVRHLGPNPAVVTGTKASAGGIDGTKVHRRP